MSKSMKVFPWNKNYNNWAQELVNEWTKEFGYEDAPKVRFLDVVDWQRETKGLISLSSPNAVFGLAKDFKGVDDGEPVIGIFILDWDDATLDTQLWMLAHEFVHYLQRKMYDIVSDGERDWPLIEAEANDKAEQLVREQIRRWKRSKPGV